MKLLAGFGFFPAIVKPTRLSLITHLLGFLCLIKMVYLSNSDSRLASVVDYISFVWSLPLLFYASVQNVWNAPSRFSRPFGDDNCVDDMWERFCVYVLMKCMHTNTLVMHSRFYWINFTDCIKSFSILKGKIGKQKKDPLGSPLTRNILY